MILVTGATGHFGIATLQALLAKGIPAQQLTALVRNETAATEYSNQGFNTAIADYDDYASLVAAFTGIEKLLFISGSDIVKRLAQHENVIRAAKEAGVQHVVYTSFQRKNETETSPLWIVAQSHIQTERWLAESGMAYTILKNNLYMDFLPGFIGENVLESGVLYVPAGQGKVGAVLRSDMAEAAAAILATPNHEGKTYDFTNTQALSYEEIAITIAAVSGRKINYISPSEVDYKTVLSHHGVPEDVIGIFSSFAIAQAQGELDTESQDLVKLLGRQPLSIVDFLKQVYGIK